MALAVYDWPRWKHKAADFLRAHPRVVALELTWGQRVSVPGAREAYAVATYSSEQPGRRLGAAPCDQCGRWTHSWCETCSIRPAAAICTTCDTEKLLCKSCTHGRQLVYSEAPVRSEDGCLEFSGVNLETGFHRLDPPVRIKVEEMPFRTDGTYDTDTLLRHVGRHPDDVAGNVQLHLLRRAVL